MSGAPRSPQQCLYCHLIGGAEEPISAHYPLLLVFFQFLITTNTTTLLLILLLLHYYYHYYDYYHNCHLLLLLLPALLIFLQLLITTTATATAESSIGQLLLVFLQFLITGLLGWGKKMIYLSLTFTLPKIEFSIWIWSYLSFLYPIKSLTPYTYLIMSKVQLISYHESLTQSIKSIG